MPLRLLRPHLAGLLPSSGRAAQLVRTLRVCERILWNLDPSGRLICCVRIDRMGLSMREERCSVGQLSGSELTCADLRPALTTQPLTANKQS